MTVTSSIQPGDAVRESMHRVPPKCLPFYGVCKSVSEDGWITVEFPGGVLRSFAPGEFERDER